MTEQIGYWERFVEIDKMAAKALDKIEERNQYRLAL